MPLRRDTEAARRFANSRSQLPRKSQLGRGKPLASGGASPRPRSRIKATSSRGRERKRDARARETAAGRSPGAWIEALVAAAPKTWVRRAAEYVPTCPISGQIGGELKGHHLIEKKLLRDEGLHEYVWDERGGLLIASSVHDDHHAGRRIARRHLPAAVWEMAAEIDKKLGRAWATSRLEHDYPENP